MIVTAIVAIGAIVKGAAIMIGWMRRRLTRSSDRPTVKAVIDVDPASHRHPERTDDGSIVLYLSPASVHHLRLSVGIKYRGPTDAEHISVNVLVPAQIYRDPEWIPTRTAAGHPDGVRPKWDPTDEVLPNLPDRQREVVYGHTVIPRIGVGVSQLLWMLGKVSTPAAGSGGTRLPIRLRISSQAFVGALPNRSPEVVVDQLVVLRHEDDRITSQG